MNKPQLKSREAYLEQLLEKALVQLVQGRFQLNNMQPMLSELITEIKKELKKPDDKLVSMKEAVELIVGMLDAAAFLSEIINALSPDEKVKESVSKVLQTLDRGIEELQGQLGGEPESVEDEVIR